MSVHVPMLAISGLNVSIFKFNTTGYVQTVVVATVTKSPSGSVVDKIVNEKI